MPLTSDQKKALGRSALALLAVAGLFFALLLANKPGDKPVKFDAVCRSFVAPVGLTLKLHQGVGEVQEATAEGFDATIGNMESVALTVEGEALGKVAAREFKMERSGDVNQTPPHLEVTPSGGLGRAELKVEPGAVISSFGPAGLKDQGPWVGAESPRTGGDLTVTLVSPVSTLKGNRYVVSGIAVERLPKKSIEMLQAEVKGAIPGAGVTLNAGGPGAAAKVWFKPETEEIPLFERGAEDEQGASDSTSGGRAGGSQVAAEGKVGTTQIRLQGCVNPDLRIEDKSATGVIADRRTDLKIEAIAGTIDGIGVVGGAEKNDAPRLRVRGQTRASSLQQDEHELLPTLAGEVMDLPYTQRGVALIALGFALFLAYKVVDRTLGVLLEYFFPKVQP
jgi:hypothetical protein